MKNKIAILIFSIIFILGCSDGFDVLEDLSEDKYLLLNSDSVTVSFPEFVKGKVAVVGYIFTNCPDICPLTTNNMRLIQDELKKQNIENVELVTISFDPAVDKPSVLKKYAEIRNFDLNNWHFLTGDKPIIDKLMKKLGIVAVVGDSTVISEKETIYYYIHTDRISLYDEKGRIRKNYLGSEAPIQNVIKDIKKLGDY